MQVTLIKDINEDLRSKWKSFIIEHPAGNFFQSPAAYEFFQKVNGYEPVLLITEEGNNITGILLAVIIKESGLKGFFSRRCIIWGGPIYNEIDVAEILVKRLNQEIGNKTIYTEFRNLFELKTINDKLIALQFRYIAWLNSLVEINDQELNLKMLNESKRRQLKKSLKAGATIEIAKNCDEIKELYNLLERLYKLKIKKPLPGFDFFKLFHESSHLGKIFIIKYNNKIIGGSICPIFKDTIYEWYVCGEDRKYKDINPSVLATWSPIQYASQNGLKYFDFMGAGSPNDDYGVRDFKAQFGGKQLNLGRYQRINNRLLFYLGKSYIRFKKR